VYWPVLKQKWCRFTLTRSLTSLDLESVKIDGLQRMERGLYVAWVRVSIAFSGVGSSKFFTFPLLYLVPQHADAKLSNVDL
jgi:hypothetical protein